MVTEPSWKGKDISYVFDCGPEYMYSLLIDYEKYVKSFGFIPVQDFLEGWKCIAPGSALGELNAGDFVYTDNGSKYKVYDVFISDDDLPYVDAYPELDDGSTLKVSTTFPAGTVYSEKVTHKDYYWKKIKEREESICPILITKTNQPQS